MPVVFREAALKLNFVVVGGGIAGLAVAYVLSRAGHRVRVLEKSDYSQRGGAQRVPPNLSKILRQWVGEEKLRKIGSRCLRSEFYDLKTLRYMGSLPWKPAVMAETGGEFLFMHRGDLIQLLYDLSMQAGVNISLNAEVSSILPATGDIPHARVTLANGEVINADIVIGADGSSSTVREVVVGEKETATPRGLTVYTGVISTINADRDPDLAPLLPVLRSEEWIAWLGENRCILGHPVHGRTGFGFSVYSWYNRDGLLQGGEENWNELYPAEKVITDNDAPALHRLVTKSSGLIRTQWMHHDDATISWVDSSGRIALLGDAAHPPFPAGLYSCSLAVEDAVVFGSLFSHLQSLDHIIILMKAYQELRQTRARTIRDAEIDNIWQMCLPDGPEAHARNQTFRPREGEGEESDLRAQFDACQTHLLYDAGDAAEEWWVDWGRFLPFGPEKPRLTNVDISSIPILPQ